MRYHRILVTLLSVFFGICLASGALADWKEDQAALFEKISVKPGDVIDSSNYQKVQDILLPSIVEWIKKGDFTMEIAELEWDFRAEEAWRKASQANEGKYYIGEDGGMYETASKKRPEYVYGEPFPNIDWGNDPNCVSKQAYNAALVKSRAGSYDNPWTIDWVGRGGLERYCCGHTLMKYFWGADEREDNPNQFLAHMIVTVTKPYDMAGTTQLTQRLYTETADQCYAYVPSVRRVKKVSGSTRSSPFLGTDFTNDDGQAFDGKIESMNWTFVEKKIILMPLSKFLTKGPVKFIKQPDGSYKQPTNLRGPVIGFEDPDWQGAPWALTDVVYVPREMWIVKAKAKDRYYNYGECTYAMDPTVGFVWKEAYNRGGEYWKSLVVTWLAATWGGKITFANPNCYVVVDAKSDHASISNCFGAAHDNTENIVIYNDQRLTAAMFAPTALSALSK